MMKTDFKSQILQGIPTQLPPKREYAPNSNHAPKRKDILSLEEKKLAVRNALRYFPEAWHTELSREFAKELSPIMKCMHDPLGHIPQRRHKPQASCS